MQTWTQTAGEFETNQVLPVWEQCHCTQPLTMTYYSYLLLQWPRFPKDNLCCREDQTWKFKITWQPPSHCVFVTVFSIQFQLNAASFAGCWKQYISLKMSRDVCYLAWAHNKNWNSESESVCGTMKILFVCMYSMCVESFTSKPVGSNSSSTCNLFNAAVYLCASAYSTCSHSCLCRSSCSNVRACVFCSGCMD